MHGQKKLIRKGGMAHPHNAPVILRVLSALLFHFWQLAATGGTLCQSTLIALRSICFTAHFCSLNVAALTTEQNILGRTFLLNIFRRYRHSS